MEHDFGYVYVLTNASMPGQVKVGMTTRRPERRGAELSAATGVPTEFQVAYYRSFEDCAVAERVVHAVLNEQGLRTAKNREFFNISAEAAQELIDKVAERLTDPQATDAFAASFLAEAQRLLSAQNLRVAELEEALTLLEHATALGDELAPFLGGDAAWVLAKRRKSSSDRAVRELMTRSQTLFEIAGERGVARGYAQAGHVSLELEEPTTFLRYWHRYLDALPQEGAIPSEELPYILETLQNCFYSGTKVPYVAHPYLSAHAKALRRGARQMETLTGFGHWLDSQVSTPWDRLLEKSKWPLIGMGVLVLVWWANPSLFISLCFAALLLLGVGAIVKARVIRRREATAKRQERRGRKRR